MTILPEVAMQRFLELGLQVIRENPKLMDDIFSMYLMPEYKVYGGKAYVEKIKEWYLSTKVPVVQSWTFNPQEIPSLSVHLSDEMEDESKAAMGDHFLEDEEDGEVKGIGVFTVNLDVGVHTSKEGDYVIWLYYMAQYVMFAFKQAAEHMGMQLHTYRATPFNKESKYMANNIWTRWLRVRTTVWNTWTSGHLHEMEMFLRVFLVSSSLGAPNGIINVQPGLQPDKDSDPKKILLMETELSDDEEGEEEHGKEKHKKHR